MTACLMMSVTACGKEEDKDSKTDENKTSQTEEKMETEDGNRTGVSIFGMQIMPLPPIWNRLRLCLRRRIKYL